MADNSTGTQSLPVNGGTVAFTDRGRGEPVLVIHAGVFAAWFPAVLADPALDGFRLIAPVRAGYDQAVPAPSRHLTLADHAAHCAAVLDSLGLERAHVLAHSSSSLIGLQLAADRPDLVRSMVLIEPACAPCLLPPEMAAGYGQALEPVIAAVAAGRDEVAFDTFMRVVSGDGYRAALEDALGPEGLRRAERESGFFFRDEFPAVHEWRFPTSPITQPALLVQGGVSSPVIHDVVARVAQMLSNAETRTVPDADHLLPLRDPATVAGIAAAFATRHAMSANA